MGGNSQVRPPPAFSRRFALTSSDTVEALRSFGYNLSPTLLKLIEQKYGDLRFQSPPLHPANPDCASFRASLWLRTSTRDYIRPFR